MIHQMQEQIPLAALPIPEIGIILWFSKQKRVSAPVPYLHLAGDHEPQRSPLRRNSRMTIHYSSVIKVEEYFCIIDSC
jgi:hypothetical protein